MWPFRIMFLGVVLVGTLTSIIAAIGPDAFESQYVHSVAAYTESAANTFEMAERVDAQNRQMASQWIADDEAIRHALSPPAAPTFVTVPETGAQLEVPAPPRPDLAESFESASARLFDGGLAMDLVLLVDPSGTLLASTSMISTVDLDRFVASFEGRFDPRVWVGVYAEEIYGMSISAVTADNQALGYVIVAERYDSSLLRQRNSAIGSEVAFSVEHRLVVSSSANDEVELVLAGQAGSTTMDTVAYRELSDRSLSLITVGVPSSEAVRAIIYTEAAIVPNEPLTLLVDTGVLEPLPSEVYAYGVIGLITLLAGIFLFDLGMGAWTRQFHRAMVENLTRNDPQKLDIDTFPTPLRALVGGYNDTLRALGHKRTGRNTGALPAVPSEVPRATREVAAEPEPNPDVSEPTAVESELPLVDIDVRRITEDLEPVAAEETEATETAPSGHAMKRGPQMTPRTLANTAARELNAALAGLDNATEEDNTTNATKAPKVDEHFDDFADDDVPTSLYERGDDPLDDEAPTAIDALPSDDALLSEELGGLISDLDAMDLGASIRREAEQRAAADAESEDDGALEGHAGPETEDAAPAPDEASEHDHERRYDALYEAFVELKRACGEPTENLDYPRFERRVESNRASIMKAYKCKDVDFSVQEKDGKASLKAKPIR